MPDERKPVEIRIDDGETVRVKVASGARFASLFLKMEQVDDAMPYLRICGRARSALFGLEPDPVLAAVQTETKRCKAALRAELDSTCITEQAKKALLAAIDAPPELEPTETETSAYRSGADAVKTEAMEGIAKLREAARKGPQPERGEQRVWAYSSAMRLIEDIIVTEPPA